VAEIYLQIEAAAARALHTGRPYPPADEVELTARALGLRLEPLHPGAPPDLMPYFIARADDDTVGGALAALRQCAAVEAAYVKPPDEAPG
jgi:hypothetical protein